MKIPRRITWAFDPNTSALEALKDPQDRTIWAVLRFGHIVDQNFNANVAALAENLRRRPPADGAEMFNRAWHFGLHGYGVGNENAPFTADLEWWGELLEAWLGKITIEHVVAGAAETDKPAEFVMVPLAPTQPMLDAGNRADYAASTHRTAGLVYAAMLKAAPSIPEDPRWQKLRDLFGLDGWHDGHYNGVAQPDGIVTHIEHVGKERARLMFENMELKRASSAWRQGIAMAAKLLDNKRDAYMSEHGREDPGSGAMEYGTGPHAQLKEDYANTLAELADEIRAIAQDAASPPNLGHPDTPLLDWLEEAYTKGALHPGAWREFMTRVAEVGYREAISERISGKSFYAMTGRAFAIADEAMLIAFDSYVPRTIRILGGAFQLETPISAELKQAIDWLEPRGFLEVTRDPVEPRVVRLIKRPRDAR